MTNKCSTSSQLLLLDCLQNPNKVTELTFEQWSLLLRMAKSCKLLAHLAWLIKRHDASYTPPEKVRQQFQAALTIIDYRRRMAIWEMNRLERALSGINNTPIIALKGCAYILLDLPFATARVFSDVDILVTKSAINDIENQLLTQQWQSLKLNDYDQSYYRLWMHEIPPLRHLLRTIEVDIHHTIIPPTSALQPDPALLMQDAVSTHSNTAFKILSPCDMVLHSAVHLFFDSDLSNKLRDLVDLDQLLRYFYRQDNDFLNTLLTRATHLGLQRPLYYTLRYTHRILNTPIPSNILQRSQTFAPCTPIRSVMDTLIPLALLPEHPDISSQPVRLARWLLFVRSHYLRMPLKLLLPHLVRKSLMRITDKKDDELVN